MITFIALLVAAASSSAQPSFQGIGDLPGGAVHSMARAVSRDGTTVVGSSGATSSGSQAFRWTAAGGIVSLGALPGGSIPVSNAWGVSDDGSVIVGDSFSINGSEAFRWQGGIMDGLGDLPGGTFSSSARGVSADGQVMVGTGTIPHPSDPGNPNLGLTQAVRWQAGGIASLGNSTGTSNALDVSSSGTTAVGTSSVDTSAPADAAIWNPSLVVLPAITANAWRVSSDGAFAVGAIDGGGGFLWNQASGVQMLGGLSARGVSDSGETVVGVMLVGGASRAFIWDASNGIRDLKNVLENDYGLNLGGWSTLYEATDISGDGRTIVGYGQHGSAIEGWVAVLPDDDADGDGLLDDWETKGVPYEDSSGQQQRYVLDVDGDGDSDANPQRKDLFLEVDAMAGFPPMNLDAVVAAFASAPVPNPNGAPPGITLHLVVDELDVPHDPMWPAQATGTFDAVKLTDDSGTTLDGFFGTEAERNQAEAAGIREAKLKAYRYALIIDQSAADVLGQAHHVWANDFFVARGEFTVGPNSWNLCAACDIDTWFRSTFMHELGHCLGLQHGGNDEVHYKPNYVSIMNYLYKLPFNLSHQAWELDYSRGGMDPLAEIAIDETVGFVDSSGFNNGRTTYYSEWGCDPGGACDQWPHPHMVATAYEIGTGGRDFNDDDLIQSAACTDLNNYGTNSNLPAGGDTSTPCQTFTDFDDWANIIYDLAPTNALAGSVPPVEPTKTQLQAMLQAMPADCTPDVAPGVGDGSVNIDDLLAVISQWGPCPAGRPCPADISPHAVADGVVNIDDLLAVIAGWGPCP